VQALRRGIVELYGPTVADIWSPVFAGPRRDPQFQEILARSRPFSILELRGPGGSTEAQLPAQKQTIATVSNGSESTTSQEISNHGAGVGPNTLPRCKWLACKQSGRRALWINYESSGRTRWTSSRRKSVGLFITTKWWQPSKRTNSLWGAAMSSK
jgi:hypothetical protein